jgi:hypothetical protein
MWDVLSWHDATLGIASWAVLILTIGLLTLGSAQHRQ